MARPWRAAVVLALAVAYPCAAGDTPTIRPLDSGPESAPAPGVEEPARTLPPTVTVCHQPGGSRCWTMPLADDCARDGGRVFRIVLGDANGRDARVAMTQCEAAGQSETVQPVPRRSIPEAR